MRKFIKIIILLFISTLIFSSCKYDRGLILFNSQPISSQNALNDQKSFESGQKVYYLFIAPKRINDEFIRVQIFKMTDKAPWGGNEVVRTKDYRLMSDERYYHTNYFTIYDKGRYVMQVFSHTDFQHPIAINYFYIR